MNDNNSIKKNQTNEKAEVLNKQEVRKLMAEETPTPNHRGRGRTRGEIKQDYARYNERKRKVFEAEETNFEHLILFLASDGENPNNKKKFYVMGGNSAVIYAYDIAPRIGRKDVTLRPDFDNGFYKFKNGVTSISNLELLTEKLKEIGIERLPAKGDGTIVAFRLNRKYEKSEIMALIEVRRDEVKEMNQILYTNVTFPDIHKQVMGLRTTLFRKLIRMSRTEREILQDKILEPVFEISDAYALMAHGDMGVASAGIKMRDELDILLDRVAMVADLELFSVTSAARVGKIAAGLKNLVVGKMINASLDK